MKNKKQLIKSLFVCVLCLIPFFAVGMYVNTIENDILASSIKTVARIIACTVILLYVKKEYKINLGIKKENLGIGILWYGIVVYIFVCVMPLLSSEEPEISLLEALPALLFYFVVYMIVGMFEEVLCRGFLFNVFKAYWGDNKKGIYLAAWLSALLFGSLHLFNLNGSNTIATITQVLYATFFGMLFAAVYYRSGNLLSCIILHGLVDFVGIFWTCFAEDRAARIAAEKTTDINVESSIIILIMTVPFLISALVQLHKVFKNRPV